MKQVGLAWTPSASVGVDSQTARIFNAETLEVYAEAQLDPSANSLTAQVPQGVIVQGSVATVRGEEQITSLSDTLIVGYDPLEGATDLNIGLIQT